MGKDNMKKHRDYQLLRIKFIDLWFESHNNLSVENYKMLIKFINLMRLK